MSDPTSRLPARPSLEQLQKQAKDLLRQNRAGDSAALERFRAAGAPLDDAALADAQFVIAREYGFETWAKLKHHIEGLRPPGMDQFERLAQEVAAAYTTDNTKAIREVNWNYGTDFACDFHDPVMMQSRLTTWFASKERTPELALADARRIVAHAYGFESWADFAASVSQPPAEPGSAPLFLSSSPPFYRIDWKDNRLEVRGPQSGKDWDTIVDVIREHRLTKLSAGGITDAGMERVSKLDRVTHLQMEGAKLTDQGVLHLARMPQIRDLEVGGPTSPITDRGLAALRHLTDLRAFKSCWTQGITDIGAANLAACEHLESVNVMGTHAGDGLIQALAGKRNLCQLNTGRTVTDRGLALLHQLPIFKTWHGGEANFGFMTPDPGPNRLLIDGPFTDAGLASLVGLDGLFGLSFFWHCPAFTSAGLSPLKHLPRLASLGCQDQHCDDAAMRRIAELPHLRSLMGQGAVATDDGFAALSHSQTLEYFWGRDCPNFSGRGFAALSGMPALHGLAVSCQNVDDAALALLPRFLALREFMPMEVPDEGFRHVGRCENLEGLWCMYCRETGDAATDYLSGLSHLKTYYAGMTKITDRSLEILGRMESLERIEFWQCPGITDAGVARLIALPRLREVTLELPNVTRKVLSLFPAQVRVNYSGG